jgi:dihydroorotase
MKILIKGGRVIDPASRIDAVQDIAIAEGRIAGFGEIPAGFQAEQVIDARGLIICPGLVDLMTHLREPGFEHKGTIASETLAAVSGGITTVCCPPETEPVTDTPALVESIRQRAIELGRARVMVLGAMTRGLNGQELSEMYALKQSGCVGVTNGRHPVHTAVLRHAMEYAASHGLTVFVTPENHEMRAGGCAHAGVVSIRLGLPGIPESAETLAVAETLQLVEQRGTRVHISQISTARAVRMIARAQYDGLPVTTDVAAHQLYLTEMDIGFFNTQCHVLPPLRTQRDLEGLRQGLRDGAINAVCSDHQPHDVDAKLAPFPSSEPGISALETLLPLTLRLVDEGLLGLSDALARVTHIPAGILGLEAGTLKPGAPADICIFDPEYYWELDREKLHSAGYNTPFHGWEFKGRVIHTLVGGRVVFSL